MAAGARRPEFPGCPRPNPPRPSSQSRKRQGHIGPLQIRRCPNKVCSGGGSFLLLIWRFRVGAPTLPPPLSLVPSLEPERAQESGTPAWGGCQARRAGRAAAPTAPGVRAGLGKPRPGAGARASQARVLQPSSWAHPPTSGTVGASLPRGGAAGRAGAEAAQERRGPDPSRR